MSVSFTYTTEQTKDCINHTEQQLRDLISTVLSRSYGPNWEYSSSVWNDEIRGQLEERRRADQGNRPYQVVSQRLLDYSDIVDLRSIIERHWNLFSGVFQSKQRIMHRFDDLQTLRNPEMHGRPDILPYQKHLCLGVCGEILAAVDYWSYGYEHAIKEYAIGLRFPVYVENEDEANAQRAAYSLAQQWLENVRSKLKVNLRDLYSDDDTKDLQLAFEHKHVKIHMTWDYKGYDGRYFRAADVEITTTNVSALGQVIEAGDHPYWVLRWTLKDDLGVSTVVSQILERTGKGPESSTSIQIGDVSFLSHAEFWVSEGQGHNVRVTLSRWQSNADATICLIHDDVTSFGFYRAHEVFSVKNVVSILYGEIPYGQVRHLLEQACSPVI